MTPDTLLGRPFDVATFALEVGTAAAGCIVAVLAWRWWKRGR